MLFNVIIAVYCKNHTEIINTLSEQNAAFINIKADGTLTAAFKMGKENVQKRLA
jgi:hypothetical protein